MNPHKRDVNGLRLRNYKISVVARGHSKEIAKHIENAIAEYLKQHNHGTVVRNSIKLVLA